jgi:hypothetical protein
MPARLNNKAKKLIECNGLACCSLPTGVDSFDQGMLTEGEDSLQLTSSLRSSFGKKVKKYFKSEKELS